MSFERPTRRTFTYRVPIDDDQAMRKIHALQQLDSGYLITEIPESDVPTGGAARHWSYKFYESKETGGIHKEKKGGTIPGLHEYRYSLEWQPVPSHDNLEMNNAEGGGTKIRGEEYIGTSDPRIPNTLHVEFTLEATPTEIIEAFEKRTEDTQEIRENFGEAMHWAEVDAFEKAREAVYEYEQNCEHNHVVKTDGARCVAYCEDCGKDWDDMEFSVAINNDELTVVGAV